MRRNPSNPPTIADWLLTRITDRTIRCSALGDFEEQFRFIADNDSVLLAKVWYWRQVIRSVPAFISDRIYWSAVMFKNYLKITLRNFVKQKGYSFINIAGLAIGMLCSMLILMWVQDELSYDTFHEHAQDIYRVVENQYYAGGEIFPVAVTPAALAPALKERFPEIIKSTRLAFRSWTVKHDAQIFEQSGILVDPDFFEIFTIPFVQGDSRAAMAEPHAILLTKETAEKYFGDEEPLGQTLTINSRDDFVVSGVIEKAPNNSHIDYDFIVPFVYLGELGVRLDDWGRNSHYTYVQLQPATPYQYVDKKIVNLIKENSESSSTEIYLQPLTKIHLYSSSKYAADISGHGDIRYVRIFSVVVFFVLLIAAINFMNLATARSERRAKEVGLRKAVGAQRSQIIRQFFGESLVMSLAAFAVALIGTYLLLPIFNDLSGKQLLLSELEPALFFGFVVIAVLTGLVSGSYPALFLSSFRPVETLKPSGRSRGSSSLFRRVLVVAQFSLSVIMIIGTLVVSKQLDYIRNKNLGLDKENLAYIWMRGEFEDNYEIAKQELLRHPSITSITATSQLPTYVAQSMWGWDWEGKNPDDKILMHYVSVDYDYVKTYKMHMAAGRFYSPEFATDSMAVVVNEQAVEIMGMEAPVGKRLSIGSSDLNIIGVVQDFHFKPIQTEIEPMVLLMMPNRYNVMVLRTHPKNMPATVDYVESVYKKFNPETPFSFHFLDQRYDNLYRAEQRIGRIFRYFAIVSILISSLGLFGLASFMAEQRTKEIGIRKTLGASVPAIFVHVSKSFVALAVLSNLIAWPVAYLVAKDWLEQYAYHATLKISTFFLSAALAIAVVIATVSYQAVKAALKNPVDALRTE